MVRVRRGAAWELSGLGSTSNFTNKLAIKCLTVNDKSWCFRGAKSLCYLTQPHGSWRSPCVATRSLSSHCPSQGPPGGKRASLGPSPFLLNSDLSRPILKTPHYMDPPVWAALSCTSSPRKAASNSPAMSYSVRSEGRHMHCGHTLALWSKIWSCHRKKIHNISLSFK